MTVQHAALGFQIRGQRVQPEIALVLDSEVQGTRADPLAHHVAIMDLPEHVLQTSCELDPPPRLLAEARLGDLVQVARALGRDARVVESVHLARILGTASELLQLVFAYGQDLLGVLDERPIGVQVVYLARLHAGTPSWAAAASSRSRASSWDSIVSASTRASSALPVVCSARRSDSNRSTPARARSGRCFAISSMVSSATSGSRRAPSASARRFTSRSASPHSSAGKHTL